MATKRVEHFLKTQHNRTEMDAYVSFTAKQPYVQSCTLVDASVDEWVVVTIYK